MVSPVFGSAGPVLTKGVDLDEIFSGMGLFASSYEGHAAVRALRSGPSFIKFFMLNGPLCYRRISPRQMNCWLQVLSIIHHLAHLRRR